MKTIKFDYALYNEKDEIRRSSKEENYYYFHDDKIENVVIKFKDGLFTVTGKVVQKDFVRWPCEHKWKDFEEKEFEEKRIPFWGKKKRVLTKGWCTLKLRKDFKLVTNKLRILE